MKSKIKYQAAKQKLEEAWKKKKKTEAMLSNAVEFIFH